MAASIKCHACAMGDCENHIEGQVRDGVMGGWLCPCSHSVEEHEEARERWQHYIQSLLGQVNR